MENSQISDPLFRQAVEAIDAGDLSLLQDLIGRNPRLLHGRLDLPGEGYFKDPYLLWFVAGNPVRRPELPPNIVDITRLLLRSIERAANETRQEQIDYALGLVATGRIPKECGVQIEMIDLLIDAGAKPGSGMGALAHGNLDAARHLLERGGRLTLAAALCLDRAADMDRLLGESSLAHRQLALVAAAFYGKADMLRLLIGQDLDLDAFPRNSDGFHQHATALHQAVASGSLESVKVLVGAGARLDLRDQLYDGTPLDWAEHLQANEEDEDLKQKHAEIAAFLQTHLTKI